MTSAGGGDDERAAGWSGPPPVGHPGPQWQGTSSPRPDATAAPAATPVRAPQALVRQPEQVVVSATGVLRIAGRDWALAGMPSRIGAYVLDLLTIWVGLVLIAAVVGGSLAAPAPDSAEFTPAEARLYFIGVAFQIAFYWVWNALGWSPGKRLLGLRIVTDRGVAPGIGRGFARTVGPMLAGAASGVLIVVLSLVLPPNLALLLGLTPAYLNYLWPFWDARRQAWHDKIASTYVVRATAAAAEQGGTARDGAHR